MLKINSKQRFKRSCCWMGHAACGSMPMTTPRFAQYEKRVDFYHTTEHLATAVELLFGKKSAQAKSWYKTYYDRLKNEDGAAESIIRSIDYHKHQRRFGQKRLEALAKERTFFQPE